MAIVVELEAGRKNDVIALRFPYNATMVAKAKAVTGSKWDAPGTRWTYPVDMTVCRLLRVQFGPELKIGPRLTAWARAEIARMAELKNFHTAVSAEPVDLPNVRRNYPTMWAAMQERGYQTVVPAFAKQVGNHFNGSQPGAGKTIETLATLAELGVKPRILIIAPKKAIQSTWPREIGKWMTPDADVSVTVCDSEMGNMAERDAELAKLAATSPAHRFEFVLINPEVLRWEFNCDYIKPTTGKKCNGTSKSCPQRRRHTKRPLYPALFEIAWDAIVMDETHKMMMNANERSGSVSGWGYGAQKLREADACLKIGLSGTPFKGKPRRFWTVLHWLRPDKYTAQGKWTEMYFRMDSSNPFTQYPQPTDEFKPGAEDAFNSDLDAIMIRHTKRELRKINPKWAPPEKVYADVMLKMEAKQAKAYEQMIADAAARFADGEITAEGVLAERTRLKQFASAYAAARGGYAPSLPSNKWTWIKEALEERGLARGVNDGSVKIVIASQYVALLKLFSAELDRMGIAHFSITGASKDARQVEEEWQSEQTHTRVMLLSTTAGGVSLTLDAADDLVLVDETDNPDDAEQVEDRVHRTSRTDHQVTVYRLISEGTIDEKIAQGNLVSDINQKAILDGRRGIEFARKILEGGK